MQWVARVLREKGPFSPEEEAEFFGKAAHEMTGKEFGEGLLRATAATLPEEERTPLNVWDTTLRIIREGQEIRRQRGEFGQGRSFGPGKER